MQPNAPDKLVIALSSRALFDLTESHEIFESQGVDAYARYQIENEHIPLQPGPSFHLVRKLLAINNICDRDGNLKEPRVEVVLLSRNSADTGLRIFNSCDHYDLKIQRAAFCGGRHPYRYVKAFGTHLFLSSDAQDVRMALASGIAAATLVSDARIDSDEGQDAEVRFAFDGDAVLFSDEAERVYKEQGLGAFTASEVAAAKTPLAAGPFHQFLLALHTIQRSFDEGDCPIRTALVTARSVPAHERVIRTLREWKVRLDESIFLGGMPKTSFLEAYKADVFFDDQLTHCEPASLSVSTGHVPHGVANE